MPASDIAPPLPQNMIPLAPLTPSGTPKHRLDDPFKAQTLVANLFQAGQERNLHDAAIQGQIDGNPPFNPNLMRKAGRAGDANFNTLEAKSLLSAAMVPYYDLFSGGNRFVEVKLDLGDEFQVSYASGIVSEEYDRMLRRWKNYEWVMATMMNDDVAFGKGFLTWCKNGSWRLQKVAHFRVFVPDATSMDLDELETIVVFHNWSVTYLMDKIRDGAAATAIGWNVKETRNAIMSAVPVDPTVPNDPMSAQAMLRDSDIYVSARNSTVQAASIFVKEFDGKWSELIVRRDQIPSMSQSGSQPAPVEFMFKRFSYYDCVQECILPFFFEVGNTNWNGASGLGRDSFVPCQIGDRAACSRVDSMYLRNSIILQPQQETDRQKMQMFQLGKMTVIPPGVTVHQSTILGDITSTIEVSQDLNRMIERNLGIYRPTLEKGGGNPDTLGEYQMKFAQATVLSTSAINRFYSQLDRMYEQQWKRVIAAGTKGKFKEDASEEDWENEARRFVKRCEDRGVTKETLKKLDYIRAFRTIGNGSAALRQQIVSTFLNPNVFPLFPPEGQKNILEDFTRILGGQTAVNRYLPLSSRENLPTNQQWDAMMENAALKIGAPVTWTSSQNNLVHAQFHLLAGTQAAQSLQQGANPQDVLVFMDAIGAHTAEHLQRESVVPTSKPAVKALEEQWKRLGGVADQLRASIQSSQENQQKLAEKQQTILTDADIKRLDVQMKNQISREKAGATLALKAERQNAELALKAGQQGATTAMADASTAASIQQQTAKTAADIQNQRAKAEAQAEAARNKPADTSD